MFRPINMIPYAMSLVAFFALINFSYHQEFILEKSTSKNISKIGNAETRLLDNLAPILVCPKNDTIKTSCNFPSAYNFASFKAAGGSITCNCDTLTTILTSVDQPVLSLLCSKALTRDYTLVDSFGSASCTQQIVLIDTTRPKFSPMLDVLLKTKTTSCTADSSLAKPSVSDNCNPANSILVTRVPSGNSFDKGTTLVTWTATDSCGNSNTAIQRVIVEDDKGPVPMCKAHRAITLVKSVDTLRADFFVGNGAVDFCGGPLTYRIRRMESACGGNTSFIPYILYCCEDVKDTIMVAVEFRDTSNNTSICMTSIEVQEKIKPKIQDSLRNVTVSCDYLLDISKLNLFGTYVGKEVDRKVHSINDTLVIAGGVLLDGLIDEVCLQSVTELPFIDQRIKNNTGNIVRRFRVVDASGLADTFQQIITIRDLDTLKATDIKWPLPYTYTNCKLMPPSEEVTGKPVIKADDVCSLIGMTKSDQIFDDPLSGCKYIRRTWKVIDWTTFVPNTKRGIYEYIQDITLVNFEKPKFFSGVCEDKVICAVDSDCEGKVSLSASAEDECTDRKDLLYIYDLDIDNNGSIDVSKQDSSFSIKLNRGVHSVSWRVSDRCGNVESCKSKITVKECKAPTAICLNGLATNLENDGTASVWAKDFNNHSSDNCTPVNQISISFSPDSLVMNRVFNCKDKGRVNLSVYFKDLDGNQSRCITFIDVQDNRKFCPILNNNDKISIGGKITLENKANMKNVEIDISNELTSKNIKSDENGSFVIHEMAANEQYNVLPQYNKDWLEGINTLDLVMIQRHILGVKKLDSPYKLIAADVDNNKKISVSDLIVLRKLILGIQPEGLSNQSWRFINKKFVFSDASQPYDFDDYVNFKSSSSNAMDIDFMGIKTGDVNGTALVNNLLNSEERSFTDIEIRNKALLLNEISSIPVISTSNSSIQALQMQYQLDGRNIAFKGIRSGVLKIDQDEYNYDNDQLNIVALNEKVKQVKPGDILYYIDVLPLKTVTTSSILSLQKNGNFQVDEKAEMVALKLKIVGADKLLSVQQNQPNPFSNYTDVKFNLSNDSPVKVMIFASTGAVIFEQETSYQAGKNVLRIGKEELGSSTGVFYLHIVAGESREVRKMMRFN
jgi:hypothetical protein